MCRCVSVSVRTPLATTVTVCVVCVTACLSLALRLSLLLCLCLNVLCVSVSAFPCVHLQPLTDTHDGAKTASGDLRPRANMWRPRGSSCKTLCKTGEHHPRIARAHKRWTGQAKHGPVLHAASLFFRSGPRKIRHTGCRHDGCRGVKPALPPNPATSLP